MSEPSSSLSVRAALTLAFGSLAALVLLVAVMSIHSLSASSERYTDLVAHKGRLQALAADLGREASARAIAVRNVVLVTQTSDRTFEAEATRVAHTHVTELIATLQKAIAEDAGGDGALRERAQAIINVEKDYGPVAERILAAAVAGQNEAAVAMMNRDCRPLLAKLMTATTAMLDAIRAEQQADAEAAQQAYHRDLALLIGACALAVLGAAGMGWRIPRWLSRALGAEPAALGAAVRRVAEGELSPVRGADQAPRGSVLALLGDMQRDLSRTITNVRLTADHVATASSQIAAGNNDLSARTEQQASALQQTASSMHEMTESVRQSAGRSGQVNELADRAASVAAEGGVLVGQVVQTMSEISASSRQIADIIAVIDGIAFQTNILALNAAVEAARAGEQGRGFAVVAGEVRQLAQRSANAAREIKTLISGSVEKVGNGSALVDQAGVKMGEIVTQISAVTELVAEINRALNEQAAGIEQVNTAVAALDQATQQNAALVEESSAAASSLKSQAADLQSVVGVFNLGEAGGNRLAGA
jgi:methyl-accepting chemotaxis protein-1 (serine sensor receptor)